MAKKKLVTGGNKTSMSTSEISVASQHRSVTNRLTISSTKEVQTPSVGNTTQLFSFKSPPRSVPTRPFILSLKEVPNTSVHTAKVLSFPSNQCTRPEFTVDDRKNIQEKIEG